MKREKLHIILVREEGKVKSFAVSINFLKRFTVISVVLFVFLTVSSILGFKFMFKMFELKDRVDVLNKELAYLKSQNLNLRAEIDRLKHEKKRLMEGAVSELQERSLIIETILSEIGIKIKKKQQDGSGGPYIPADFTSDYKDLIFKVDKIIKDIRYIPLGFPVYGKITSRYGRRIDPFLKRWAFHQGIDIKAPYGTKVRATADGVVRKIGRSRGYGKYVIINHGNGFSTLYAHLWKIKVRRGKRVKRGDVIGYLGNTGRSTGPHVHYEVRYRGRPLNPEKFMLLSKIISSKLVKR